MEGVAGDRAGSSTSTQALVLPEGTGDPELRRGSHPCALGSSPACGLDLQCSPKPAQCSRAELPRSNQSMHRDLQGIPPCRSFHLLLRAVESSSSTERRCPELVPLLGQWAAQVHLQQTSVLPPAHVTGIGVVYKY